MKGKTSEHSAESSMSCLIMKMPWCPQHWGLSHSQNPAKCLTGLDQPQSPRSIMEDCNRINKHVLKDLITCYGQVKVLPAGLLMFTSVAIFLK
jgi:hypothetical protein